MGLIAVDLNSTSVTSAALGKTGKILQKEKVSIENLSGSQVSDLIQVQIRKILKSFEQKPIQIKSAGVSVPGIYYSKIGNVWAPNIPGWENYPLRKEMNQLLIEHNILVKIASKRTCDILGEQWLGAAKKTKNAVYLSVGKGIGAGILIDGKILHGFNDGVGAIGWMALGHRYCEEYKARGCLEYYTSAPGILNSVKVEIASSKKYSGMLKKKDSGELIIADIFRAYELNDPIARKVLNRTITFWGIATANLISLFNPEIIIFGGSLFGPALKFLDNIRSEAEKWAQPIFMDKVKFVSSQLGASAALFGAGHLALRKF